MKFIACFSLERAGQMTKYMGEYYWTRSDYDLRVLRSKKYNRLMKLRSEAATYLNMKERRQLQEQMGWIDAVLEARATQTELF